MVQSSVFIHAVIRAFTHTFSRAFIFAFIQLIYPGVLTLGLVLSHSSAHAAEDWTKWAKRVGYGESARVQAIAHFRRQKGLNPQLIEALETSNRGLALDVISALGLKSLIPDLLSRVEIDTDGFLTLTVNSLLDEQNAVLVLNKYVENLAADRVAGLAPAVIVAMLEPLGRVGKLISKEALTSLFAHSYPEVRSAALYYLRVMALRHGHRENDALIVQALNAREFQIRLQAVSLLSELLTAADDASAGKTGSGAPTSRDDLVSHCQRERLRKVKGACLLFLRKDNDRGGRSSSKGSSRGESTASFLMDESDLWKRAPASKTARVGSVSKGKSSCLGAYRSLFAKGVVRIRVVFGYKDARPARFVGDRHERLAFVQRLLAPCGQRQQDGPSQRLYQGHACGFVRDLDDADLFAKVIQGPDGKRVKVQLRVVHSSAGSDDEANRDDPFQAWQSAQAVDAFYNGIREADIVFYNGHSRFGGGPDFEPPRINKKGDIQAWYYQKRRPGLTKAKGVFQAIGFTGGSDSQTKVLGLFSCASSQHFTEEIRQYSKVGLISSRHLIYYADALDASLSALSSILEMRCRKDFNAALKRGARSRGIQIQGFLPSR